MGHHKSPLVTFELAMRFTLVGSVLVLHKRDRGSRNDPMASRHFLRLVLRHRNSLASQFEDPHNNISKQDYF